MEALGIIRIAAFVVTGTAFFAFGQGVTVTYSPYIQLGDNGPFGGTDQIVVAWQTNEGSPSPGNYRVDFGTSPTYGGSLVPTGRVMDNYLAADGSLPISPFTYDAHSNYSAVLTGLSFNDLLLPR